LEEAYADRGIVLVLGAGVSKDSGLPMWDELLWRVHGRLYGGARPGKQVRRMGAPELASLLHARTRVLGMNERQQREMFAEHVRAALYSDFDWKLFERLDRHNAPRFVTRIDETNMTLRAVSAMCVRVEAGRFAPNPHVKAVVTFNLDNILQSHSRAKYCEKYEPRPSGSRSRELILRSVERPSASSRVDKTSVFHMHGMIRFDKTMRALHKHAPDQLVLTEQDYFDRFNDPTSFSNYTLLHLLREHTAVFVGLSMHDQNLRRLLHYSVMERKMALQAERKASPGEIDLTVRRHVALLKHHEQRATDAAHEQTLAQLGVHIRWMSDYGDIPAVLGEVYGSADEWGAVFD
jgi:hypothetical protein